MFLEITISPESPRKPTTIILKCYLSKAETSGGTQSHEDKMVATLLLKF